MNIYFVPLYEPVANFYSKREWSKYKHLLSYDSHIVIEPGEDADMLRGLIIFKNSPAKVTVLEPGESIEIPFGESAFFCFECTVSVLHLEPGVSINGWSKTRVITKTVENAS